MVRVQMRADDNVDVARLKTDMGQPADDVVAGLHDRHHQLRETTPPRLRILRHRRMTTRIEQHVALSVAQQHA